MICKDLAEEKLTHVLFISSGKQPPVRKAAENRRQGKSRANCMHLLQIVFSFKLHSESMFLQIP